MTANERIFQAQQICGQQIATQKLPSWSSRDDLLYPVRLSMEQCSSELTALYKVQVIHSLLSSSDYQCTQNNLRWVDLTGGLGVDCAHISTLFAHTDYVEQNANLCRIAQHNFQVLGLPIQVHNTLAEDFLKQLQAVDVIFIDPARRNTAGGKVFRIEDCAPNVVELHDDLLAKTHWLVIKLSPMLDITAALQAFPEALAVHILSIKNECKELLLVIRGNFQEGPMYKTDQCPIICTELSQSIEKINAEQTTTNTKITCTKTCSFTKEEEANAIVSWASTQVEEWGRYLYEPGAALLKGGGFKWISHHYQIAKLHPHSHLYVSNSYIEDFPGKIFRIEKVVPVHKKQLGNIQKAHLSIRNFPGTVAQLRKKLGLQEGGDLHLFATTLYNEQKVLIETVRLEDKE